MRFAITAVPCAKPLPCKGCPITFTKFRSSQLFHYEIFGVGLGGATPSLTFIFFPVQPAQSVQAVTS